MAGRPSPVAGILTSTFGRSTILLSSFAWAMVPSVSRARPGSTSIDTRPSTPPVASKTGANRSQASRTSSVVRALTTESSVASRAASSLTWAV